MHRRSAYTLFELLLALGIGVLLLAAVTAALDSQMRMTQAGRDLIDNATLGRVLLQRISTDVATTITLNDPGRFRREQDSADASADTSSGGASATAGTSTTGTSTTNTGTSTTNTSSTTSSTSSSSTSAGGTSSTTSTSSDTSTAGLLGPVQLPLGLIGTASELHLFVSRVPQESFGGGASEVPLLTSDLRRITYWVAGDTSGGLCRMEARLITAEDALAPGIPSGETAKYLYSPEVRTVEFSYFDGSGWTDSWDSTAVGTDGITPQGPPRAVRVRLGLVDKKKGSGPDAPLKYMTRVIPVPTANGTASQDMTTEGGTTP